MNVLLLAAGLGTRLRPITNSIPKCLVPIHGKPLLAYWLDTLLKSSVDKVLINTHYFSEAVESFCKSSPWSSRIKLVYEPVLLGTAGTIVKNLDFFNKEDFGVIHADNLSSLQWSGFADAHFNRPTNCNMTMMLFETDDPQSCGIVELSPQKIVTNFHEKAKDPPGNLANGAVYIFSPEVFSALSPFHNISDISTELLPHNLGKIFTYINSGYHRDIGTPQSLAKAHLEFTSHNQAL